jgi:hypothetical protein
MKDIEKHIRERWFPEHKATLTHHGDLQVLQWAKPGTSVYSCRYVFDGNKMYISGDIGTAVFWLTWKADVHSFNDIHIDYFEEKLDAYSGDRRNFNGEKAAQRLREWKKDLIKNGKRFDKSEFNELIYEAESCSSKDVWAHEYVNRRFHDFIYELDNDYWNWIYEIGDEIPARIHGYLLGLKMASEQLKVQITDT